MMLCLIGFLRQLKERDAERANSRSEIERLTKELADFGALIKYQAQEIVEVRL